ncbi:CKLF-like MARVEL transmembrane domain-containing protein 7 [Nelusetta ayraudi]|uniref:CKLF-like MARVEL transmembrane domain-containing protein 7 n=1 Tax=Nelusetta ayraudi TaxID=303726 RepID=UPI003F6E44D7
MSHSAVPATSGGKSPADSGLNAGYLQSLPGLLKVGQTVALLVSFLCVHCTHGWPKWAAFQFFELVALWFLVVVLLLLLLHLFRLHSRMSCINWPLTEFFHYSVGTVLVFIASVVAAVKSGGVSALVVASVFGFITTFLMAVSLWTSYGATCGSHQTGAVM